MEILNQLDDCGKLKIRKKWGCRQEHEQNGGVVLYCGLCKTEYLNTITLNIEELKKKKERSICSFSEYYRDVLELK